MVNWKRINYLLLQTKFINCIDVTNEYQRKILVQYFLSPIFYLDRRMLDQELVSLNLLEREVVLDAKPQISGNILFQKKT